MLDPVEAERVRDAFDSTEAQVRRDHAISHVLAALQAVESEKVFFGGTALSRTFLIDGRLSEDIDLYSSDRQKLCQELDVLPDLIEQEFPQASWDVLPSETADPRSSLLICEPSIQIKIQIVESRNRRWARIPIEIAEIHQRYSDVVKTKLFVPTFDGFVAMKVSAWLDRHAARDLFDLDALSRIGEVSEQARVLIEDLLGHQISTRMLVGRVSGDWQFELAHQTRLERTEEQCMIRVANWWSGGVERDS